MDKVRGAETHEFEYVGAIERIYWAAFAAWKTRFFDGWVQEERERLGGRAT